MYCTCIKDIYEHWFKLMGGEGGGGKSWEWCAFNSNLYAHTCIVIKCQFTESFMIKKKNPAFFVFYILSTISFCRLIRKIMYYTSQTQESVWHGMILSTIWVPLPGLVQASSWLSSGRRHLKRRCRIWLDSLEWVSTHLSWVSFSFCR